jgi:hypothetical protein
MPPVRDEDGGEAEPERNSASQNGAPKLAGKPPGCRWLWCPESASGAHVAPFVAAA